MKSEKGRIATVVLFRNRSPASLRYDFFGVVLQPFIHLHLASPFSLVPRLSGLLSVVAMGQGTAEGFGTRPCGWIASL